MTRDGGLRMTGGDAGGALGPGDGATGVVLLIAVAERDAHVLVSTNCSALGERALEVMARYCLKETRRAATFHRPLPLPDFPPRTGASSLWLALR